jgi:hypothetical protein
VRLRKTAIFLRTAVSERKFELETSQIQAGVQPFSTATFNENYCHKEEHKYLVGPEVLAAVTMKDKVWRNSDVRENMSPPSSGSMGKPSKKRAAGGKLSKPLVENRS